MFSYWEFLTGPVEAKFVAELFIEFFAYPLDFARPAEPGTTGPGWLPWLTVLFEFIIIWPVSFGLILLLCWLGVIWFLNPSLPFKTLLVGIVGFELVPWMVLFAYEFPVAPVLYILPCVFADPPCLSSLRCVDCDRPWLSFFFVSPGWFIPCGTPYEWRFNFLLNCYNVFEPGFICNLPTIWWPREWSSLIGRTPCDLFYPWWILGGLPP